MRIDARLRERILPSRFLPVILACVAVALASPSLWTGWQQDDLLHRYYLLGNTDSRGENVSAWDMFGFLNGDSSVIQAYKNVGVLPWWTTPRLRLAFWRPLAGATHAIDYALWPDNAVLMHAQSLVWFGLLIAATTLMYRRLMGATWVAGLAALLYALDDAHGLPAGWLANRNALLAALFGSLALLAHDSWRRHHQRGVAVLGPVLFALAMLAGETALGALAYLLAYALTLDPGTRRQRLASLVPYAGVAVAWMVVYRTGGYGTNGSGFYIDPLSDPIGWLQAFMVRAPVLLTDQLFLPPSSLFIFIPEQMHIPLVIWSLAVILAFALILRPVIRNDVMARFWGAGMLLSLPIITSTTPHSRLLMFSGLGAMALLALWLQHLRAEREHNQRSRGGTLLFRAVAGLIIFVHALLAPLLLPLNAVSHASVEAYLQKPARAADLGPGIHTQDLILLNPPVIFLTNYFMASRTLEGLSAPRRQRALAPGNVGLRISRTDDRTLTIRPDGGFLNGPFDNVFRTASLVYRAGDREDLEGVRAEILSVDNTGKPEEVAFRFDVPLEHESLRWLRWEVDRWVDFPPPPVGDTLRLPAAPLSF